MIRRFAVMGVTAASLTIVAFLEPLRAEVAVVPVGARPSVRLVMGIIDDGPDPIGSIVWRDDHLAHQVLNAGGVARGDLAPDMDASTVDGRPVAVWSYADGAVHDIAYAEWDVNGWGPTQFLTNAGADDLDPRSFVAPDGAVHVVWWTPGPSDRVYWITRAGGSSTWGQPQEVTCPGSSCRRPSVVVFDGSLRIAFERDSDPPNSGQDIVVSTRLANETFDAIVVAHAGRVTRLDARLNVEAGRMWLDWKVADDALTYARLADTSWTPLLPQQAPNISWVGIEDARRSVRRSVLAP